MNTRGKMSRDGAPVASKSSVDPVPEWKRWTETIALTAVAPAFGAFFLPTDPFFVNEPFCWPLLGVVTVGLRYGLSSAYVAGATVLIGALASGGPAPSGTFISGVVLLTLLAGEFGHRTRRRGEQEAEQTRLAEAQASALLARHQALAASHTLLERASSSARFSLREALQTMQERFRDRGELSESTARRILELFNEFGSVSAASLLKGSAGSGDVLPVVASLGVVAPVSPKADLVREALTTRSVAAVGPQGPQPDDKRLLAVVPLIDLDGKLHGLVAVHDLPFLALHEETLQLFAVLGGYLGDMLTGASHPHEEKTHAWAFNESLERSLSDLRTLKLPATLVRATANGPDANGVLSVIEGQQRSIDRVVRHSTPNDSELVFLLPLTNVKAAEACRQRMETAIAVHYPEGPSDTRYTLETIPLTANDKPGALLARNPEFQHVVARSFGA